MTETRDRPDMASRGEVGPVLFFDGQCGLCNRLVRLLLRLDRKQVLHFAPLQGPSAQWYLRRHGLPTEDFDSLIFVPNWHSCDRPDYLVRTDGALAAIGLCPGFGLITRTLKCLPRSWRDLLYKSIARTRYRIFGEWIPRPLKRAEWYARFLDSLPDE